MGMIEKIIRKVFYGRKMLQPVFKTLYNVAVKGMNYGNDGTIYESGELNTVHYISNKSAGQNKLVIFDVGANVGDYSVKLAEILKEKATIHSFEPSPAAYKKLQDAVLKYQNVTTNNFGLSDTVKSLQLYSNFESSGLASLYQRKLDHYNTQMNVTEEINLSTVDNYCEENKINYIDFLKLDVEGHELSVLNGAKKLLAERKIKFIQFEFGGCNIDSKTFFQDFYYLLNDNYKIYRILKNGLSEIKEYNEANEIFKNINFLAELR